MVKYESIYDVSDAWKNDPELGGNLETQICNMADELAYTTHDSDDGLRSSKINLQMLESISLWEVLINKYSWTGPFLSDMERHRMISDLVGLQVTDMIQSTDKRLKDSRVTLALDIYKLPSKLIGYNEDMLQRNRQLKISCLINFTSTIALFECRLRQNISSPTFSIHTALNRTFSRTMYSS